MPRAAEKSAGGRHAFSAHGAFALLGIPLWCIDRNIVTSGSEMGKVASKLCAPQRANIAALGH
jgi:hypothetical protein